MKIHVITFVAAFFVSCCVGQDAVPLETRIVICPENFVNLGSHCYYFSQEVASSWDQAWELCREFDEHSILANVASITKWHHIRNYIREKNETSLYWWLGGTDRDHEGNWMWMGTNQPFPFDAWCKGEPNNLKENEHCVHILLFQGEICWNDLPCDHSPMRFICEA